MARPVLGELELQQVQRIDVEGDQILDQHAIAALEGDFFQRLGRRATRITLTGILTSSRDPDEAKDMRDKLKQLRDLFLAAQPVEFVSDITTATQVDQVLIEAMSIRELAGQPERYEYAFTLREFTEAPEPPEEPPPPRPEPPESALQVIVEISCERDIAVDFNNVTVTVSGTQDDGTTVSRRPIAKQNTDPADNVWVEEPFPPGSYTVEATLSNPEAMSATQSVTVPEGERVTVTVTLNCAPEESPAPTVFRIHFWFDKAFIEPCLRPVMREVAEFASQHADHKLLIVGHTDKTGSSDYNQSLSERRARSAFAYLTAGRDQNGAVTEWDNLRRTGTGVPSIQDDWTQREAHYMLQDLGFYSGPIDDARSDMDATKRNAITTDTPPAIRAFQTSKGLPPTGTMNDATWRALIQDYLAQDNLSVPEAQFFPNCDPEILKWIGCGELDTLLNTENAYRPNRRTEFVFVRADQLPCPVPQPVTFNLPSPGAVNSNGWCAGPTSGGDRTCLLKRADDRGFLPNPTPPPAWTLHVGPARNPGSNGFLVQPPSDAINVRGSIRFGDGTPLANAKYVLLSPIGLFMDGEISPASNPDRGRPIPGTTDANGAFSYTLASPEGMYSLEVRGQDPSAGTQQGPFLAQIEGEPFSSAKGAVVCKRLTTGDPVLNVIITPAAVANVVPDIQISNSVVVRKKPHTNPARQPVILRATPAFTGSGTLTRSSDRIHFFDAAAGGNEITFNGTDNVFTDAQLIAGHTIFAEGFTASAAMDDVTLTLSLTVNGLPGRVATRTMTCIELTLDICNPRPAPGVEPAPLSEADKINVGRRVQLADPDNTHTRAMLIVRQVQPAGFTGSLELRPLNAQITAFDAEQAGTGNTNNPFVIAAAAIPANGSRFFAEGVTVSAAARPTGFQLGVQNGERDGDRVMCTVIQLTVIDQIPAPSNALRFVRVGLWDNAFDPATGNLRTNVVEAQDFIGSDTRKFHFRLQDASSAGALNLAWRTVFADNSNDHAPAALPLPLTETPAGSGIFFSRAVFLVTDNDDRDLRNSGLPAGHADLTGQRIRKITVDDAHQLDSHIASDFTPAGSPGPVATIRRPVFQRNPEERLRMRVHLVNVRDRVGGTGILTPARRTQAITTFRNIYAMCGIFVEFIDHVIDPPASCTGWATRFPGDPLALDPSVEDAAAYPTPSASMNDIITAVRALPGFDVNDVYLLYVANIYASPLPVPPAGLAVGPGGLAFPDSFLPAGSNARSMAFVGVRSNITALADPHEATHNTTNLRNAAGGHFDLGAAGTLVPGNIDGKNLMHRFFLNNALGIMSPKRLWDTAFTNNNRVPAMVIPRQIDAIRTSRFRRNF